MAKPKQYNYDSNTFQLKAFVSGDWQKGVIRMKGEIDGDYDATDFDMYLRWIAEEGISEIEVQANGPGGNVFAFNQIVNSIAAFEGKVNITCGAFVASGYTYLLAKCKGKGKRKGPANMQAMIHKPHDVIGGNIDEIKGRLKRLETATTEYKKAYTQSATFTEAELDAAWIADYWMDAEEFKAKGFIDEIIADEPMTNEMVAMLKACGFDSAQLPKVSAASTSTSTTASATLSERLSGQLSEQLSDPAKNDLNLEIEINDMEKSVLRATLGLSANATDAEVTAKLEAATKAERELGTLQARLETEKKEAVKLQAKTLIDAAVKDRKVTEDFRASLNAKFEMDFEAAKNELEALKPVPALSGKLKGGDDAEKAVAEERKDWSYADWAEKDAKGLKALMSGSDAEKAHFTALFKGEYGTEPMFLK